MATSVPPKLSTDRRWFWDGEHWLPYLPDPEPQPATSAPVPPVEVEPSVPASAPVERRRVGPRTIALAVALVGLWINAGVLLFYLHARVHTAALIPSPAIGNATPLPTVDPSLPAIPAGRPIGMPLTWPPSNSEASLTALPDGVDYALKQGGVDRYAIPTSNTLEALRFDADVALVHGPASGDGIGLGCTNIPHSALVYFYLYSDHVTVDESDGSTPSVVAQLATRLDHSGVNHLTMLCDSTQAGTTHVMVAVNGTTVFDRTLPLPAAQWWGPMVSLCSCGGGAEATYRNLRESWLSS